MHPLSKENCTENGSRFNSVIPSIVNFTIRGALWYQ